MIQRWQEALVRSSLASGSNRIVSVENTSKWGIFDVYFWLVVSLHGFYAGDLLMAAMMVIIDGVVTNHVIESIIELLKTLTECLLFFYIKFLIDSYIKWLVIVISAVNDNWSEIHIWCLKGSI